MGLLVGHPVTLLVPVEVLVTEGVNVLVLKEPSGKTLYTAGISKI